MSKTIQLSKVVKYSKKRIDADKVSLENFITIDNILQNRAGIMTAINLPPSNNAMPAYGVDHILVGNIRPYLKKIWFSNREGGCSSDVLNFEVNQEYFPKFVYYSLFRDDFFNHMMRGAKGTKMPRGDKNQILDFIIPDFDFPTQQKIAAVLSALDVKIELNQRINAELEAMAKTLYDYWFVQFDFPNEDGKPYKSSGGKMVWNEHLKREIPEGWEVGELNEIANITMGQSPPGKSYNENGEGMIFFQGCTDFGYRFPSVRQFTTQPKRLAKKGDILLSVRAPVGTLNIAKEDCCIGRGLAALNGKDNSTTYLFEVMKYFKQVFDRRNVNGTTFGSITKDDLFSLKVIKPDEKILEQYQEIIQPTFEKQNKLELESQTLTELRDWLLPMLMNGQVRVA